MIQHTIKADGRTIVLRAPTWADVKRWALDDTTLTVERAVQLVKSVDGVEGTELLTPKASLIVGAYIDDLLGFGPEEGGQVLLTLTESMDGIFRVWKFSARGRTYTVREASVAVFALTMKRNSPGAPGWNALAEACLVEIDDRPPPPGSAAAVGVPVEVMNYIVQLVFAAASPSEAEVKAAHQGAALVET